MPMIPPNDPLSTPELARKLGTQNSNDLQAIDDLTLSERQWLESEMQARDNPLRRPLLAAIRLKRECSLAPYYARSHLTELAHWLPCAIPAGRSWNGPGFEASCQPKEKPEQA